MEFVEIDIDCCMALDNLNRRAAAGTLDSFPKHSPKGASSRCITRRTDPVVAIPRALSTVPRAWTGEGSMVANFHAFMTSAGRRLSKILGDRNVFTPTTQARGQGLHDGAFVLQFSLYSVPGGGWWIAPRCGASYNSWSYLGAIHVSAAFDIVNSVCSCSNGYVLVTSVGKCIPFHRQSQKRKMCPSLGQFEAFDKMGP